MDPTSQNADALRIQAAAVVAQQAALLDEESRLHERQQTIEHQETQLASLLEEKRRRLATLRDEVQHSRKAAQREQTTLQQQVAETTRQTKIECAQLADGWEQVGNERRRLFQLRDRLRRRWHRNWAKERAKLRRHEAALRDDYQQIRRQKQEVATERESLEQFRLQCNGEAELARRETQAVVDSLNDERVRLHEHAAQIARRESSVGRIQRQVAAEKRRWLKDISRLQAESQGLKNRIQNNRCKLIDLERRASRLASIGGDANIPDATVSEAPASDHSIISDPDLAERAAKLDTLASELSDQRIHLAEQWQRFLQTEQTWSAERERAATQLEELARNLDEREVAVEISEARCRQRAGECDHQRRYLQGVQAHWTARVAAWHGERERLHAELRSREIQLQETENSAPRLLQRWQERYQLAALRLKAEYAACLVERRRYTALADAAMDRGSETLDPSRSTAVIRTGEAVRLDARFEELKKWAVELAGKDAEIVNLLSTYEHGQSSAEMELSRLRHQVGDVRAQATSYQRQLVQINEELERVARLLMSDGEAEAPRISRAA